MGIFVLEYGAVLWELGIRSWELVFKNYYLFPFGNFPVCGAKMGTKSGSGKALAKILFKYPPPDCPLH